MSLGFCHCLHQICDIVFFLCWDGGPLPNVPKASVFPPSLPQGFATVESAAVPPTQDWLLVTKKPAPPVGWQHSPVDSMLCRGEWNRGRKPKNDPFFPNRKWDWVASFPVVNPASHPLVVASIFSLRIFLQGSSDPKQIVRRCKHKQPKTTKKQPKVSRKQSKVAKSSQK